MAELTLIARLDDQISRGADAATAALKKLADAGDQVEVSTTKASKSAQGWVNSADKVTQATNALSRAQKNLADATLSLNDGLAKGKVGQDEVNRTLDALAAKVGAARAQVQALNNPMAAATGSSKAMSLAMRDLGLQSIDVFQGIATGQPILRTLVQQGAQVAQVNAAMGVSVRQFAGAITGALLSPLGLSVTALAAVAAGTVAWIAANESAEKSLLNMQARLRATRTDWEAMGEEAAAAAKAVSLAGNISGADARAASAAISGSQNFNGSQQELESLIKTAGDLATVMGQKVPEAAKALREALDDPAKVAKTLAEANFPGMTNAMADSIRRMDDMGRGAEATKAALDIIHAAVDDALQNSLTPLQQVLNAIGAAFENLGTMALDGTNKAIVGIKNLTVARAGLQDLEAGIGTPGGRVGSSAQLPDVNVTAERPLAIPPIPPTYGANYQSINDAVGKANDAFNSSKLGQIQHYNDLITGAQKALHDLADQGITTGDAVDRLNRGIKANQESLDKATKTTATHISALQKQGDTITAQITAQEALRDAYLKGGDAVEEVLAKQAAAKKLISDNLVPGTQKYAAELAKLTDEELRLAKATGEAQQAQDIGKQKDQLTLIQAETDSLGQSNEAREVQIARLQETLKLKEQHADITSELSQREIDNAGAIAQASAALQQQQAAIQELGNIAENIFDSIGNAITNAFVSGSGAAVNFGNVVKGIMAQVLEQIAKLAIINPLLNGLFGGSRQTLGSVLGAVGGIGGASSNGSSTGGSDLLGQGQQLLGIAGIGDKLGLTNIQGSISKFLGLNGGISGFLSQGLFGTSVAETLSGTGATSLAGLGADAGSFGSIAAPTGILGGASIGSLLGGVSAGFAAGSLAGMGVQKLLGKTGPAPTIGAGAGAVAGAAIGSIIPGIGTPLGGLVGGIFKKGNQP